MSVILLNDLHPNDLFRFINVRPLTTPKVRTVVIISNPYDGISDTTLSSLRQRISVLTPTLAEIRHAGGTPDAQLHEGQKYRESEHYLRSESNFEATFPETTSLVNWLDENEELSDETSFATALRTIFGEEYIEFCASIEFIAKRCQLWDNIVASLLSQVDPGTISTACKYFGALHLANMFAGGNVDIGSSIPLWQVYRAKAAIPIWVYALAASRTETADLGIGDQPHPKADPDPALIRFLEIEEAVRHTRRLVTERIDLLRTSPRKPPRKPPAESIQGLSQSQLQEAGPTDPFLITRKDVATLQGSALRVFDDLFPNWKLLTFSTVMPVMLEEVAKLAASLANSNRNMQVRVGNSIVARDKFCAEITEKDPCAQNPRKDFLSRGSFLSGISVGDLLVTRQQLVKYAPGEIAHIEALMIGLTKERSHRRLNRTESTLTTESESVNETERETQTTERFSMEKEAEKTLSSEFKISAGINTMGVYGTTQVTTSLDSSFGTSSVQTDRAATRFSRDVTSRALKRVKETLRETRTLKVINEIEETSLHRLSNQTNDHQNGVYRWLDKFYLNKIVKYGVRMIPSFAVAEPANEYIFRHLAAPAVGMSLEKPVAPRDVIGPDGFSLEGPNILTDTNYAFWIAAYGVEDATPPPQDIICISKAYKSDNPAGPSNNVYDSFAADIKIPENYGAYTVGLRTRASDPGGGGYIEGVLDNQPFWFGYTAFYPSYHRESVGLSLVSFYTQWALDVVIYCKRSSEYYEKWKIDTYSKIVAAYNSRNLAYEEWLKAQYASSGFGFDGSGKNTEFNRKIERNELKKRCLELFSGQRWESFDAATDGIFNVSAHPEILFEESIREGNIARFFEQAFEWENMSYVFYPYYYGRKANWLTVNNLDDANDPLFSSFLQSGQARVEVPVRPNFENFVLLFNIISNVVAGWGGAWQFQTSLFRGAGISNEFLPGIADPLYISIAQELAAAVGFSMDSDGIVGHGPKVVGSYVQKVPTNLVYVTPRDSECKRTDLPDNSSDPDIRPYLS
jgi:hypothetical protein